MNAPATISPNNTISHEVLASVLMQGDLAKLSPENRIEYMLGVCKTLGLNPTTRPFEFIVLNGKLTMYAKRDCTEQLRKIHGVSVEIKAREIVEGVYVVTAAARDVTGRCDESIGAVPIDGLKGDNRANAMMKAETKAKRRVTLSICGLGMLDEVEVDPVPGAKPAPPPKVATVTGEVKTKKPEWTKEQSDEAAALRKEIIELGGNTGDDEVRALWKRMAYDAPSDVIDAMSNLVRTWRDIADQAVVVEGVDHE